MKRIVLWVVVLGIVMVGLATGPDMWAAAEQSPARQTVPTRTPQPPPPPLPQKKPSPAPTAAPATSTPLPAVPAGGSLGPLLPGAGGRSARLPLGAAMVVAGLLVLATVRRRW